MNSKEWSDVIESIFDSVNESYRRGMQANEIGNDVPDEVVKTEER